MEVMVKVYVAEEEIKEAADLTIDSLCYAEDEVGIPIGNKELDIAILKAALEKLESN